VGARRAVDHDLLCSPNLVMRFLKVGPSVEIHRRGSAQTANPCKQLPFGGWEDRREGPRKNPGPRRTMGLCLVVQAAFDLAASAYLASKRTRARLRLHYVLNMPPPVMPRYLPFPPANSNLPSTVILPPTVVTLPTKVPQSWPASHGRCRSTRVACPCRSPDRLCPSR